MSGQQVIERVWQAPIALVWELWTTAEGISSWFGPRGFTVNVTALELREGGAFNYTMQAPDGKSFDATSTFTVVAPPHRLAYVSPWGPESMTTSVEFSETEAGVHMKLIIDATKPDMTGGAAKGWQSSLERFGERLANAG